MKRNGKFGFSLFTAILALSGCSGVPNGNGGGGGGGGGGSTPASLAVTLTAKPALALSNISVLSANVGITGLTLNPSSGSAVPLVLLSTIYPVDLMRLQSDATFLGTSSVAVNTYSSVSVTFSAPELTIFNQTGATLNGTCLTGTICHIVLPAGSAQITSSPLPLTLASAQAAGLSINLDLNTALTVTGGTLALNFSTTNAASVTSLPRKGTPSGALDLVEDFLGKVTATTASSITVQSSNGIALTFTLPTSPTIEDPLGLCAALNATCLVANQTVVSVNAKVNTDGTLTLISADLLDATPVDEIEGTVVLNGTPGQFFLVVNNKVIQTTTNATLTSAAPGDTFLVTLSSPTFIVDTDELFNNSIVPTSTITGLFNSEGSLVNGQDVMVRVTAATGTAAVGDQALTANQVRLRFSRVTGTVQSVSGMAFTLSNVPPYIPFLTNPIVETIPGVTVFENVSDVNSIQPGQNVSIRAMLVKNSAFNFYATKVRLQP